MIHMRYINPYSTIVYIMTRGVHNGAETRCRIKLLGPNYIFSKHCVAT
jgi:hypothetical protein